MVGAWTEEVDNFGMVGDIGDLRRRLRHVFAGVPPPGDFPGDSFCQECFEGKHWWEISPESYCHFDSCQMYGTGAQRAYYFIGLIDLLLGVAEGSLDVEVAASSAAPFVWNYEARENGGLYARTFREHYGIEELSLLIECFEAVSARTDIRAFVEVEEWQFFGDMLKTLRSGRADI